MIFWTISIVVIALSAIIIIRLIVNKDENADSKLGILEHPSMFEKQPIEHVDKSLAEKSLPKTDEKHG